MTRVLGLALLTLLLGLGQTPVPAAAIAYDADRWDRLVITVESGGRPLRLLLDTGAAQTILRPDAYASLGVPSYAILGKHVVGATGRVPVRFGWVQAVRFGACELQELKVLIADIGALAGADGLIGVDWLARMGPLQLDLGAPSLQIGSC